MKLADERPRRFHEIAGRQQELELVAVALRAVGIGRRGHGELAADEEGELALAEDCPNLAVDPTANLVAQALAKACCAQERQ